MENLAWLSLFGVVVSSEEMRFSSPIVAVEDSWVNQGV